MTDMAGEPATGMKVRVETTAFDESLAFYDDLIGMTVLERWDEADDKGVILGLNSDQPGSALLELAAAEKTPHYHGLSLQFRGNDINATASRLDGKVQIRGREKKPWGSNYIHVVDPSGLPVILNQGDD